MKPLVSIIIPTFNRANTVGRAINSVLRQTYENFEIVVVEDGSKDETKDILQQFMDSRLSIIYHEVNKGVTAAKNTGLNNIRGEWFAILDSDDEITPDALETMMKIPLEQDPDVNAVTCNCVDTGTGNFSGKGLDADQYLDIEKLITMCRGEFWGMTKSELLLNDRFNERLGGLESTLWYRIDERAKRYYIHKGLRIFHTEGDDRISKIHPSIKKLSGHYQVLSEEENYLQMLQIYLPGIDANLCLRSIMYLVADNKKKDARFYYNQLKKVKGYRHYKLASFFVYHSNAVLMNWEIKLLVSFKILE